MATRAWTMPPANRAHEREDDNSEEADMIHLLALMLSLIGPLEGQPKQIYDDQSDAAAIKETVSPPTDECPGIAPEVLAHIVAFAESEFANSSTYGSVLRDIRNWAKTQKPQIQFSSAQRKCWQRHVKSIRDKKQKRQEVNSTKAELLEVTTVAGENRADIYAQNNSYGEITVRLVADMTNMQPSQPLPLTTTLPPKSKQKLVQFDVQDARQPSKFHYDFKWAHGSLDTQHDDQYHYRLPYEKGRAYKVGQSFGGAFSHHGAAHYAVDFLMPERTRVYAAREGLVVATKSSSNKGGTDKSFAKEGNSVFIRHADKTLASYFHFRKDGVVVNAGDSVKRGQLIGYSGNTGWSSGPHLHFEVKKLLGGDMGESVPFLFESRAGVVKNPKVGESYFVK